IWAENVRTGFQQEMLRTNPTADGTLHTNSKGREFLRTNAEVPESSEVPRILRREIWAENLRTGFQQEMLRTNPTAHGTLHTNSKVREFLRTNAEVPESSVPTRRSSDLIWAENLRTGFQQEMLRTNPTAHGTLHTNSK